MQGYPDLPRWNKPESEFFRSYHLPVLSAKQNNKEQAHASAGSWNKIKKIFSGQPFCFLCLAAAQKITHSAHSLTRLGELHV